jgi:tRNA(Ile)-lysidine synthase
VHRIVAKVDHVRLPLLESVQQFFTEQSLGSQGVVVAVSGGPDSVALLHALVELRTHQPLDTLGPLIVAHLNHLLRGPESDTDDQFVQQLVATLSQQGVPGLSLVTERLPVASLAAHEKENQESVARRIRYDWLSRVAVQRAAALLATGHTADDQAETVMHHLLRGTGLRGLRGIAPRRRLPNGLEVIRPLLQVPRADVLAYLESKGQSYRQDSTNFNLDFTRNRIRHQLLPLLVKEYNPALVSILTRLAEQAAELSQDLEVRARAALAQVERPRAGDVLVFDQSSLGALPRPLLREVLRLVWDRERWPMGNMGFRDWVRLTEVGEGARPAVDLPGGIRARRRGAVVLIGSIGPR